MIDLVQMDLPFLDDFPNNVDIQNNVLSYIFIDIIHASIKKFNQIINSIFELDFLIA
jgi:hypothetical protein